MFCQGCISVGKSILIQRNVLSEMHFHGKKHPDSEKCSVRDAFPWEKASQFNEMFILGCISEEKSILIQRNVLSGMHFRGGKHPQVIESADRDAMSVSLPAYGAEWEV